MRQLRDILRTWGDSIPAWGVGLLSFLLCWLTFLGYYHWKFDLNEPPATSGDEVSYDSLGWELAHGRGFRINTGEAAFRKPYDDAAKSAERFRLGPPVEGIVTYRPPLYPLALSGLNRIFGRQFWAVRVMDAAFMAGTLCMLTVLLYRRWGWLAVFIAWVLFIAVDSQTRLYGRAILTEAMSLFLTSLMILQLLDLQNLKEPTPRRILVRSLGIGIVLGLSLLTRTLMVLWVPGLMLVLLWILRRLGQSFRLAFAAVALFLMGLGVIVAPWAVRNITLTGELMPLGTQGGSQLSAAFGEEAWREKGVWVNLDRKDFFAPVVKDSQTHLERELQKAKYSQSQAIQWIKANPIKAVVLFPLKIWQECRPRTLGEWIIRLLCLMGAIAIWRTALGQLLLAILAVNFFAIGITWSVEGRFLLPVLLPIHFLAVMGGLWLLHRGSFNSRESLHQDRLISPRDL